MRSRQRVREDEPASQQPPPAGWLITAIQPQVNHADRVNVEIDGTFAFGVHLEVATSHGLRVGERLSPDRHREMLDAEQLRKAEQVALVYLAHKPRTIKEVRDRLRRAGYSCIVSEQVVDRLRRTGLLDDDRYARAYAENRMSHKAYGSDRIKLELRRRGVSPDTVDGALAGFLEEHDERSTALELATKRWHQLRHEGDLQKRRRKLVDYLLRRGYSPVIAREALEFAESAPGNPEGRDPLTS